jgi:hypothetical protein
MVQLGKAVKGKAPTRETRRAIIRVRMQDQSFEDLDRESQMMRIRRDNLRNAMVEEQKLAHLNRMKILTHWRKVLRLAKTEHLKKII